MLQMSAQKAAAVNGIKLGKDLSGVTMSCQWCLAALSTKKRGYKIGLGTYLSGSGDLWQYLLLLGHLQPLQPYHMSPHMIVFAGVEESRIMALSVRAAALAVRQV